MTARVMAKSQQKPNQTTNKGTKKPVVQTFAQHINELRKRLFLIIAACLVIGGVVYNYNDFFIHLIMSPLGNQKLIYLNPAGGFNFIFSVTFYITMIFAFPVILYQLYAFIRPAIPLHTKRMSVGVACAALLLMVIGVAFGYVFAVPSGLHFLTTFASDYVTPTLTADSYLTFVLGYIFGIGLLFEVPLLLLFWHWINPLTPKGLLKSERYVIVIAFIAAAVISPTPDALNQTIIALPIIIMYQFGVIGVLISVARKKKKSRKLPLQATGTLETAPPSRPAGLYYSPLRLSQLVQSAPLRQPAVVTHTSVSHASIRRTTDGFVRKAQPLSSPQRRPSVARTQRQSPHVVMNRQPVRLISDFGPVRQRKIVDM